MQNPLSRAKVRLMKGLRVHPSNALLIAYRDGELPSNQRAQVSEHLQRCGRCKEVAFAIEEGLSEFNRLTRFDELGPILEAGLRNLEEAMQAQQVEATQRPPLDTGRLPSASTLTSIREELTIYLGARAAERILPKMPDAASVPQDLVDLIEPLMAGLLGNRGGAAVADKVAVLVGSADTRGDRSATL